MTRDNAITYLRGTFSELYPHQAKYVESYIKRAEADEGPDYWEIFESKDDLIEDFEYDVKEYQQ